MNPPNINQVTVQRRAELEQRYDGPIPAADIRGAIIAEGCIEAGVLIQFLDASEQLAMITEIRARAESLYPVKGRQPWIADAMKRIDYSLEQLKEIMRHG